jgi:hypothetical protein
MDGEVDRSTSEGPEERAREAGELARAFARGDHRRTRVLAERLRASEDPEARALADDYLRRLRPDPGILRLLGGSFLFLLLLTAYVYAVGR